MKRSTCPIAAALDLIGDRWTLLVVRDLMFTDKRRYAELQDSPEGIPTNILAERLRRLQAAGIVEKKVYQERPRRHEYALTRKGADLFDVLAELIRWGGVHVPGGTKITEARLVAARERIRARAR